MVFESAAIIHPAVDLGGRVVLASILVLILARHAGVLCRRLGQPPVVGEIITGFALGPSFLGAIATGSEHRLFAPDVGEVLHRAGTVGVVIFVFLTGLGLTFASRAGSRTATDMRAQQGAPRGLGSVVMASALACLPTLLLGGALALGLILSGITPTHGARGAAAFSVFTAAALTVTALPVLSRIITERPLKNPVIGQVALVCAATSDVVAWAGLGIALTLYISPGPTDGGNALSLTVLLILTVLMVGRTSSGPRRFILRRFVPFFAACTAAVAIAAMGVHPIVGAFILGIGFRGVLDVGQRRTVSAGLGRISGILMPLFFVSAGFNLNIFALDRTGLALFLLFLAVAVAPKFLGAIVVGRTIRWTWHDILVLGALLNTRGVTEIALADIGIRAGIINQEIFTVLVLTALATTIMTAPLIGFFEVGAHRDRHDQTASGSISSREDTDRSQPGRVLVRLKEPASLLATLIDSASLTQLHLARGPPGDPTTSSEMAQKTTIHERNNRVRSKIGLERSGRRQQRRRSAECPVAAAGIYDNSTRCRCRSARRTDPGS